MTVENEFSRPVVRDVSFVLKSGEILGICGIAGNGQRELAESIVGLRERRSGRVYCDGTLLGSGSPPDAIAAGVSFVPEDRFGSGLVGELSIADNLILKRHRDRLFSKFGFVRGKNVSRWTDQCIAAFHIHGSGDTEARNLSGGNAQKVVLARELSRNCKVLVASSPTRGLDVGAIDFVRGELMAAAERGVGILLISEDLDEVLEVSDRVVVMFRGELVGEMEARQAERNQVGRLMAGKQ